MNVRRTWFANLRSLVVLAVGVSLLGAAGCAGELESSERFLPDGGDGSSEACAPDTDVQADILAVRCAGAACHSAEQPAAGLDLVSEGLAERVVDVPATCEGQTLVVAGDPDGSYLLDKLGPEPACGDPMPIGQMPLPDDEIACIREWVEGL